MPWLETAERTWAVVSQIATTLQHSPLPSESPFLDLERIGPHDGFREKHRSGQLSL